MCKEEKIFDLIGIVAPVSSECLEYIVDSLCDLLANETFFPSMFASFDCNPTALDFLQPVLHLLASMTRCVAWNCALSSCM